MTVETQNIPFRLDPCPAEERVCDFYDDLPAGYLPATRQADDGYVPDDSGVVFQQCGGGRRVIRKKIGA